MLYPSVVFVSISRVLFPPTQGGGILLVANAPRVALSSCRLRGNTALVSHGLRCFANSVLTLFSSGVSSLAAH